MQRIFAQTHLGINKDISHTPFHIRFFENVVVSYKGIVKCLVEYGSAMGDVTCSGHQ